MDLKEISSRQKRILSILLESKKPVTVKRLSKEINVSARTIHRELSGLKKIVKKHGLQLETRTGVGSCIRGTEEAVNKFRKLLAEVKVRNKELTPEERQTLIIQELLAAKEIEKLTTFAYRLSVTQATISYDMDKVTKWFEKRGLTLVRKPGIGAYLKGPESAFRKAIADFLYENLGEEQLLSLIRNNFRSIKESKKDIRYEIKKRLLNFIDADTFTKLEKSVDKTLEQLDFKMADSSYVGLIVHLALAIERLKQGEKIYLAKEILNRLRNTKEFETAKEIVKNLEKVFEISIPIHEVGYITMHLKGAKLREDLTQKNSSLNTELEILKITRILVNEVEKELGVTLSKDLNLISGLITHLGPAITRLTMGMEIRNPVLQQVREQYSKVFAATKKACRKLSDVIGYEIPESEIGFLSMHIAAAVERANMPKYKVKVLIVCSSGIGSSKILAVRLKKAIENIEIVDQVSALSFNKAHVDTTDVDLVISTVPLDYNGRMVVVTPILFPDEIKKIKEAIKQIPLKNQRIKKPSQTIKLEDKLEITAIISEAIVKMLRSFKIKENINVANHGDIIKKACDETFLPTGSNPHECYKSLLKRERIGSTVVPDIKVMLLHAKTKGVNFPFIGVLKLNKDIPLKMENSCFMIDRVIVVLVPENSPPQILQIISSFSASIIENREFSKIVREGSKDDFLEYLRNLMEDYYNTVVNEGGEK